MKPEFATRSVLATLSQLGGSLLLPYSLALAQPVSPVPTAAPTADAGAESSPVVELSPFQVIADNRGYQASSTVSGTRLNSKLDDLAASITVVTKQQLIDTAAVDLSDIFLYEANTEGTGNFTAFEVDRNRGVNDNVQASPESSNRVRGIGAANIARGNFATLGRVPVDSYNTDAVEISRGPNSNIFGLGEAAGTVNLLPALARLTRPSLQFSLRGDDRGGYRATFDLNRPLLANQLAVRALALYEDKGYVRKPAQDITRRQQFAVTWRPFRHTTLRASAERYSNFARRPNTTTPRDGVSTWLQSGRPTWDPITFTARVDGRTLGPFPFSTANDLNLPLGLFSQGTVMHDRGAMFIEADGTVGLWTPGRLSTTANPNQFSGNARYIQTGSDINKFRSTTRALFTAPGLTDRSLYDWTEVNALATNFQRNRADLYHVELEHFFLHTPRHVLAANAGWFLEDFDRFSRNFLTSNSTILMVDVNERLLDGRPNPYFLRPYIGAPEPTFQREPQKNDNVRAQLAYQLDLTGARSGTRWLGQHRFSSYWETRRITTGQYRFREAVLSNHAWINSANRGAGANLGRAYYKYYVGDNQGFDMDYAPATVESHAGSYDLYYRNGATGQWINEPALFGDTGINTSNRNRREIRSRGLVTQNFLLQDRLVTTFGFRRDHARDRTSRSAAIDPTTGLLDYEPLAEWNPWNEVAGTTRTTGVVARPLRGFDFVERRRDLAGAAGQLAEFAATFSIHYNTADTFQPAPTRYNLFGELLPNPSGEGKDYGVSFSLLKGKLHVRLNRYETLALQSRDGDAGTLAQRVLRQEYPHSSGFVSYNFYDWSAQVVSQRFAAQGVTPSAAQLHAATERFMQLPDGFLANLDGKSISETSDIDSRGLELEVHYHPTPHWTIKLAGAKQRTIDSHISPGIQRYIDWRLPVWTQTRDDSGNSWWTGTEAANGFGINVTAPLKLALANQGKPRSQIREWRFNATTSYNLAGFGSERPWLRNLTVGGAVRWEDRAAIGFLGAAPDPDGTIRSLDPDKPVFDDARTYVDVFARYRFRFWKDKVRGHVQLNVRDLFEDGRLQAVGVNPDGAPFLFRIVDPRQFILTTSFEL